MIELKNVTKSFQNTDALSKIGFEVKKGEFALLKGASGSGKSTILSLIAGLSKPTSGEVFVKGKSISKLPDDFASLFRRENIGFIFQKFNLIEDLSVKENIILPLIPSNIDEEEIESRVVKLLQKFDIQDKESEFVKNLSGGQQQRVVICRALINNPDIIIADEPTANLDEKLSLEFVSFLQELRQEGKTIVVATHDAIFFELDFCDRVIELHKGEVV